MTLISRIGKHNQIRKHNLFILLLNEIQVHSFFIVDEIFDEKWPYLHVLARLIFQNFHETIINQILICRGTHFKSGDTSWKQGVRILFNKFCSTKCKLWFAAVLATCRFCLVICEGIQGRPTCMPQMYDVHVFVVYPFCNEILHRDLTLFVNVSLDLQLGVQYLRPNYEPRIRTVGASWFHYPSRTQMFLHVILNGVIKA